MLTTQFSHFKLKNIVILVIKFPNILNTFICEPPFPQFWGTCVCAKLKYNTAKQRSLHVKHRHSNVLSIMVFGSFNSPVYLRIALNKGLCRKLLLHPSCRKLCLVWLVEVLDKAIKTGVLVAVSKHLSLDSLAESILPSCKCSHKSIKHSFPR